MLFTIIVPNLLTSCGKSSDTISNNGNVEGDDDNKSNNGKAEVTFQVNKESYGKYKVSAYVTGISAMEVKRIGCLVYQGTNMIGSGTLSTGNATSASATISLNNWKSGTAKFQVVVTTIYGQSIKKETTYRI